MSESNVTPKKYAGIRMGEKATKKLATRPLSLSGQSMKYVIDPHKRKEHVSE